MPKQIYHTNVEKPVPKSAGFFLSMHDLSVDNKRYAVTSKENRKR